MIGYVDPGEYLAAAAIREIKEETGVETEFKSIIAFRLVKVLFHSNKTRTRMFEP